MSHFYPLDYAKSRFLEDITQSVADLCNSNDETIFVKMESSPHFDMIQDQSDTALITGDISLTRQLQLGRPFVFSSNYWSDDVVDAIVHQRLKGVSPAIKDFYEMAMPLDRLEFDHLPVQKLAKMFYDTKIVDYYLKAKEVLVDRDVVPFILRCIERVRLSGSSDETEI
ncbi:hypothetical protein HZB07_03300 [Candidatus Saganbacteria bacterium]|nr:hypothetical protein [Candidatus Saganbacteria bacterium]